MMSEIPHWPVYAQNQRSTSFGMLVYVIIGFAVAVAIPGFSDNLAGLIILLAGIAVLIACNLSLICELGNLHE
ncbi:MAG: hypothetical protein L0956_05245 [Candidatus Mariimomonas ferrooxydans]